MKKQQVLDMLRTTLPVLQKRYGVTRLALFGSTARDQNSHGSDIDILVAFDSPATAKRYFGVQFYLEDQLGRPVDLVTVKALRPQLRPAIEQELVYV
jgi:predicted nucleotidyltransferase